MIPKSLRRRGGPSLVAGLALLIVSALVAGCAASAKDKHFDPKRVSRHEQAGSARVAVLSVGHFDREAVAALQPDFTMSASQALKEVLPTTFLMEQKLLDVLKVALGANLAPTAADAKAPETPVVDVQGDRTAADLPGKEKLLDEKRGDDPFLRYTLATAFYQDVVSHARCDWLVSRSLRLGHSGVDRIGGGDRGLADGAKSPGSARRPGPPREAEAPGGQGWRVKRISTKRPRSWVDSRCGIISISTRSARSAIA